KKLHVLNRELRDAFLERVLPEDFCKNFFCCSVWTAPERFDLAAMTQIMPPIGPRARSGHLRADFFFDSVSHRGPAAAHSVLRPGSRYRGARVVIRNLPHLLGAYRVH